MAETDTDRITFSVDQIGTPILVRASYFPNWQAEGADGPYRVAPNYMVVVPTQADVILEYRHEAVDVVAIVLTIVGILGLVALTRVGPAGRRGKPEEPVRDADHDTGIVGGGEESTDERHLVPT